MNFSNIGGKILLIFLVADLLLIFFLPVNDPDFGWHYRCGEQVLAQHQLCLDNNFSYFLPDYHWAYSGFAYDISLARVFDEFGFMGVSVLGAGVFALIFLSFYFLLKGPFLIKSIAIFSVVALSQTAFSLGYRSQILGLLFFVAFLFIFKKIDSTGNIFSKYVYLIPLLLFFWANTHMSFFLGLMALGLFLSEKKTKLRQYWWVFPISVLIVCINPFGWRVYQEVVNHFWAPLNTMIAEWVGPVGWQKALIGLSALGVTSLSIRYKRVDYRLFLLLIFAYFAISARRNLPLYYLMFFYILLDAIDWQKFSVTKFARFLNPSAVILLASVLIFWGLPNISQTKIFSANLTSYCQKNAIRLPCQAIEKMRDKTGNVFNTYEWGGFMIWQLPKIKVFVDGRMPAWQDEQGRYPYAVYLSILQTQPGWDEELKKYGTDYLFIGNGTFLDLLLQEDKQKEYGWQEEYRDTMAAIYHRI